MRIKYYKLLAFLVFACGLGLKAQTPISVGGTKSGKDVSHGSSEFVAKEKVGNLVLVEKKSAVNGSEDNQNANEEKARLAESAARLESFVEGKTVWRLMSIDIDRGRLVSNGHNYAALLAEVQSELDRNIVYVEGDQKALLATQSNQLNPLYFGKVEGNGSNLKLYHEVENCRSCSKVVAYTRRIVGDQLQVVVQADDASRSDVYYVFNFTK